MKNLARLLRICKNKTLSVLLYFLTKVFFYKLPIIIFSQAKSRYNGNARYLFEYLVRNGEQVFWLYTDKVQKQRIPLEYQQHTSNRHSYKAFILALRAKYFVISHGSSDLGNVWNIAKHNTVLNLWHAIGIKQTGLLDASHQLPMKIEQITKETGYYSFMTVSSDIDRYVTSASHAIDVRRVLPLGNPKTDHYLNSKRNQKSGHKKNILYAPTFRDYPLEHDLFFPFEDFSESAMRKFFAKENCTIYLRPHPNDIQSNKHAQTLETQFPENIRYFSQTVCDDVDAMMHIFDVVVTDYSSIFVEPLLADVPCIFIPFDFEKYMLTRGLAYDFELVTPGPKVTTFCEFITALSDACHGANQWSEQRKTVTKLFFSHHDALACQRIAQSIFNIDNHKRTS